MKDLNNFSNLFIFITGIYFGGFTFLGYFDIKPLKGYQAALDRSRQVSADAKNKVKTWLKQIKNPEKRHLRDFTVTFSDRLFDYMFWFFFSISGSYSLFLINSKKEFLQRYTPAFLYSGFFLFRNGFMWRI